jgi:choice-of-anchor B domain-containing protein
MNNLRSKASLICFLLLIISVQIIYSQLGNHNTILLAQLDEHNTGYSACWGYVSPEGREYALLGCFNGTAFIDITDTMNIHEVDFVPGLELPPYYWREMKAYSHYAYIVSEATGSGLQIVDLQYLPDSVHLVNTFTFSDSNRVHTISQSGPYLYLNGGDYISGGVFILDLTADPVNPVIRGNWEDYYVHDSRIVNDTIWACNIYDPPGTMTVIDATNKDSLRTITSWVNYPNPFPHNCAITADRKFIFTTDETIVPPGKLKVWNIENLSNVTFVTDWHPTNITNTVVHNVEIYGNYAVIAHYTAGIRIVDVSNPASPVEVAWYDTFPILDIPAFDGCWGVFMFPSGKIIGSDMKGGLFVIKTTFPIGIQNTNSNIPQSFVLFQNFPNPFNPNTKIRFDIPISRGGDAVGGQGVLVKLVVFDVLGREVITLVDKQLKPGSYEVEWDASNYPSGVYFYKLITESFAETRKMALAK